MDNSFAWDEFYATESDAVKPKVDKTQIPKDVQENERVANVWWNRLDESDRIKHAEDEYWVSPNELTSFQIRRIFIAVTDKK